MSTMAERRHGTGRTSEHASPGWWATARRVKEDVSARNLSMVAAGAAFFGLLALFPALAAAVALYGLFTDPSAVGRHLDLVAGFVPQEGRMVLEQQLQRIAATTDTSLGLGAAGALLVALWSAAKGVKSLMTALAIVYDEREQRGFLRLNATAMLLTLAMLVVVPLSLAVVAVLPALIDRLPLPEVAATAARWLRWPLLGAVAVGAIALLYRFAPPHDERHRRGHWVGAIVATVLWLVASALFSWYVSNFGSYNETYGSVAAVAVLMMWFWLSAFAVLIGGEVNATLDPPRALAEHGTVSAPTRLAANRPRG
jgi:membrane protein